MSLVNKSKAGKPKTRLAKAKESIYFEKQESRLCGQHCLNNALQSAMFDAMQLSEIAQELDAKERERMAELGTHTQEYKEFIEKPSSNYDDSGYFSIQVLSQALNNLNLEMVPFLSKTDERAQRAFKDPINERLFICHQSDHWLSIRKFGPQWMNLNSTLKEPVPIGNTYLGMLLQTLQTEGYSIFTVFGELPACEAERRFVALPVDEDGRVMDEEMGYKLGSDEPSEDEMIRRGIEMSLAKSSSEITRARREAFLEKLEKNKAAANSTT